MTYKKTCAKTTFLPLYYANNANDANTSELQESEEAKLKNRGQKEK